MASEVRYAGVGTFEFLLDADEPSRLAFIEANPRLQVEHTVTEEVTGIDLVATQLALAAGRSLADLGLRQEEIAAPRGFALQVRVNMETLALDGTIRPSAGVLGAFEVPTGPGIRVDRSEEHTSELQSRLHLVCRLLLEKKKNIDMPDHTYTVQRNETLYAT